MSNMHLKVFAQIIREVGVLCPPMNENIYYTERHLLCNDLFEYVQSELDYSKEKILQTTETHGTQDVTILIL